MARDSINVPFDLSKKGNENNDTKEVKDKEIEETTEVEKPKKRYKGKVVAFVLAGLLGIGGYQQHSYSNQDITKNLTDAQKKDIQEKLPDNLGGLSIQEFTDFADTLGDKTQIESLQAKSQSINTIIKKKLAKAFNVEIENISIDENENEDDPYQYITVYANGTNILKKYIPIDFIFTDNNNILKKGDRVKELTNFSVNSIMPKEIHGALQNAKEVDNLCNEISTGEITTEKVIEKLIKIEKYIKGIKNLKFIYNSDTGKLQVETKSYKEIEKETNTEVQITQEDEGLDL